MHEMKGVIEPDCKLWAYRWFNLAVVYGGVKLVRFRHNIRLTDCKVLDIRYHLKQNMEACKYKIILEKGKAVA